ncbi:MAG: hypothetical protein L6R42_010211 [Xanthoria sp. 1 TBL-2021]|nr:MAG: hypothetical protein L6R42_010211 [Xanthoria sp. 1 TBL-2021]
MAVSSQIEPDLNTYETGFTPGARGDIGLTTIFTPPSTCLDVITYDGTSFWQGGLLQTGDQDCYPPRFLDIFWSQYTPGICPHGWTSLGGQGAFIQSDGNIGTKAFCCPSGFYHSSTNAGFLQHACASVFGSPLTRVFSTSTRGEGPMPRDADLITVDPKAVESNTVYADIIGIHWAETNSQVVRLMSETSSSSPTAASTNAAQTAQGPIPIASPTAPAASTSTPSPGGLSTGAEAGIGIGAAVGAIALALFAYFLWRRRRKAINVGGGGGCNEAAPTQYRVAQELDSEQAKSNPQAPAELPSNGLPSQKAPELPAHEVMPELGSDPATNGNTGWSTTTGTMSSRNPSQK